MTNLLPRESGKLIASRSNHVKINNEGIIKCSDHILKILKSSGNVFMEELFKKCDIHPNVDKIGEENAVNWFFFADTINFSMWTQDSEPQYTVTYNGDKHNGYMAMCAAMNRTLDSGISLVDPKFYSNISEENLNEYLMGDNKVAIPMIKERVQCLKEASNILLKHFDGSVIKMVKSAQKSAQNLLKIITDNFKSYQDNAILSDGTCVTFYKRAQIFIADLSSLFNQSGIGEFYDIDSLTMFGDYRVPQSLQYFGVFSYSDELLSKLQSNELLANKSEFEVDIRGCSIRGVELITQEINKNNDGIKVNDILVDYFLWKFRREKADEMIKYPYHKTRSVYY